MNLIIAILLTLTLAVCVLYSLIRYAARNYRPEYEKQASNIINAMNDINADIQNSCDKVLFSTRHKNRRSRCMYIASVALACKGEINGITVDTPSNRLVARDFCSRTMKQHGMRPHHISSYLDLATAAVFMLTDDEINTQLLIKGAVCTKNANSVKDTFLVKLFRITGGWGSPHTSNGM